MKKYEVVKVGGPVELVRCGKYIAASDGKIYKLNWHNSVKMRELKQTKRPDGYLEFKVNGKRAYSHRFVAMCFIPNPTNLPEVNHINEIKDDNRIENLEWCNRKYNCNYGTHNERMARSQLNRPDKSKPVSQFKKSGEFITIYPSVMEAARHTGVNQSNISSCCHGKLKSAGGYMWRHA